MAEPQRTASTMGHLHCYRGVSHQPPILSQLLFGSWDAGADAAAAFPPWPSQEDSVWYLPPCPFHPHLTANLDVKNTSSCSSYLCFPSVVRLMWAGEVNKGYLHEGDVAYE